MQKHVFLDVCMRVAYWVYLLFIGHVLFFLGIGYLSNAYGWIRILEQFFYREFEKKSLDKNYIAIQKWFMIPILCSYI